MRNMFNLLLLIIIKISNIFRHSGVTEAEIGGEFWNRKDFIKVLD